jgi:hypothetical protein
LSVGTATVGVTEHGNSAVLVTVDSDGTLVDRRRIDLTRGLPTHPHHHEGSWAVGRYRDSPWAREITLGDAIKLVGRVREAAARGAREGLEALAADVPIPIARMAIRICPALPATVEERIAAGEEPENLDKELVRLAYAARGFTGDGDPPPLATELAVTAARAYLEVFEALTGRPLAAASYPAAPRVITAIRARHRS